MRYLKKSFTLAEVVIVIIVLSLFLSAFGVIIVAGFKSWGSGLNRTRLRQDAALSMQRMVRELSQAYGIRRARVNEIIFWVDEARTEEVTYIVNDNGDLVRIEGTSTVVLAFDTQAFDVAYRDINNIPMVVPTDVANQDRRDDIRVITIALTLNKEDETVRLTSGVFTRNQGA